MLAIFFCALILAFLAISEHEASKAEKAFPVPCIVQVQRGKGAWVSFISTDSLQDARGIARIVGDFPCHRVRIVQSHSNAVVFLSSTT